MYKIFIIAVLGALSFSNDATYRAPHGWPDRWAYGEESRALDAISSAGGRASVYFTYDRVHIDFPEQCENVREREQYYFHCGFGVRTYGMQRDSNASATDRDISHAVDIPHVVEVDLCGTAVTDVALERLAEVPDLLFVNVYGTAISSEAVSAFKLRRPDVRVHVDDPIGFDSDDGAT